MSSPAFETFLARLYTDGPTLERFLENPQAEARRHGLTEEEVRALQNVDREALRAAARSYRHKRERKRVQKFESI